MKLLAQAFRWLALSAALALVVVTVLYLFFDLRLVVDGEGFHLRFVKSADELAAEIVAHREAQQRAAVETPPVENPAPETVPATPAPFAGQPAAGEAVVEPGAGPPAASNGWTGFRGPRRDGHYTETAIVTAWPPGGLEPMWKQPVGGGYASFAVANGRAFTIEQRGPEEVVAAYDIETGRELWTNRWTALFSEILGGDGPRATPAWADGFVYALGGTGELRCLDDETGSVVWRTNILEDHGAANISWGMAASPLIVDDTVVVLPGGPNGHSVAAYDRQTGNVVWTALDDEQGYTAPMLATIGGVRQIVVFSGERILGLTTDGSRLLWAHPWETYAGINAAQPVVLSENRIFVSSGYGVGAAVLEIDPAGDTFTVREVWRNIRMKNQFAGSVLHDGHLYGLDGAILACIDAATGELKWKGGRYGYGQVVLADGHLIVLTENGDLALVDATPERHVEIARFPAIEGKTWNYPALSEGRLIVRNLQQMAAFDLRRER
ncbi:MAG TPA: PQQ-binding-like beta-propeller repeat protein [Vicinamibacterales bacterium]|nr:PQQ-binding-like beta-propeller repeat protein [Vicinamibacterales bacterium]